MWSLIIRLEDIFPIGCRVTYSYPTGEHHLAFTITGYYDDQLLAVQDNGFDHDQLRLNPKYMVYL